MGNTSGVFFPCFMACQHFFPLVLRFFSSFYGWRVFFCLVLTRLGFSRVELEKGPFNVPSLEFPLPLPVFFSIFLSFFMSVFYLLTPRLVASLLPSVRLVPESGAFPCPFTFPRLLSAADPSNTFYRSPRHLSVPLLSFEHFLFPSRSFPLSPVFATGVLLGMNPV